MSPSIIELNDSEIRVARGTDIILRTPGYAVLKPDTVILGTEAIQLSHLHPRETSNRFWSNLNQDPLATRTSLARHNADLAYRQLLMIHEQADKPEEFIFSVPGSFSEEQLSLLLGIVEACPFAAAGLVDTAVAAAVAAISEQGNYVHIDIHLHETVLTFLNIQEEVRREEVRIVDDCGITDIYDACAGLLADLFVQQSRFDPLHHAETEQALYDQIPACLAALNDRNEVSVEIRFEKARHQARLFREPLLQTLDRLYTRILERINGHESVLIGDRLGDLPGFGERIRSGRLLAQESVFHGIHRNLTVIHAPGPPLRFVISLPVSRDTEAAPAVAKPLVANPASDDSGSGGYRHAWEPEVTHVLIHHQAFPLGRKPVYLSAEGTIARERQDNSHCSATREEEGVFVRQEAELSLFVNGHRINGDSLVHAGDTLGFAGSDTTFRFIHVQTA